MTNEPPSPQRRKAYSYVRFSTPEQAQGDSFRRQFERAKVYARQHDLDLDDTLVFHDKGVSSYRGKNADEGQLASFREHVEHGEVPQGSVLLVEQLDRISRMTVRKAMNLLGDIVDLGVSVVTLSDGQEYTKKRMDEDPMAFMMAGLMFIRANEESATKSFRLRESWAAKIASASSKPLTATVPAWLQLNRETQKIEEIPDRVLTVRRVFDMTLAGAGQHKIAETFNREGMETWGTGKRKGSHWHRSYIHKILTNEAVTGILHPHRMEFEGNRKRRVPLAPIPGYYPAVIASDIWVDTQALLAGSGAPRGRQASAPLSNILARLACCPKCERTMTRVQKGKKSLPSLVCTAAKAGAGCEYKSVRYSPVETRLLQVLPDMIQDREGLEEAEDLEERIQVLDDAIFASRCQIEEIVDLLLAERSPALVDRLRFLERDLPGMQTELELLKAHRDIMAGPVVGSRIGRAIEALRPKDGVELDRVEANLALRGIFKRAIINWPKGTVDLEWHLGGVCRVHYAWMGGKWPPAEEENAKVT